MSVMTNITIWSDADHEWFFLIPQDIDIPEGNYTIQTLLGREEQVDPTFLEEYIVPREYAEAYLSGFVREGLDDLKQGVMSFLGKLRDTSQKPPTDTAWNVDFLADLFIQSPEAVRHDPEATKEGLTMLFAEAAIFFQNVKSEDEEQQDMAQHQLAGFLDMLKSNGVKVSDAAYDIPDTLIQGFRTQQNNEKSWENP